MKIITLSGSLAELARIYASLELNAMHLSALCSRLAHLPPTAPSCPQPLFFAVAFDWLSKPLASEGRGARQAANLLWGAAKLGFTSTSPIIHELARETTSLAMDLDSQQTGIALHALATLKYPLSASLLDRARHLSTASGPQTAANTLWAMAALGVEDIEDFATAAARVAIMPDFIARHGSMSLWGLATVSKLGILSPRTSLSANVIGEACVRLRFEFSAHEASIALWATSTMLLGSDIFFPLVDTCVHLAAGFSPQNAANALWALAHYKGSSDDEFSSDMSTAILVISQRARELRSQMNAQEIANSLWSAAILGIPTWIDFAEVAQDHALNDRQAAMALYGFSLMSQGNASYASLGKIFCSRAAFFEMTISAEGSVLCLLSAVALKLSARACMEYGFTSSVKRLSDAGLYSPSQLVKIVHCLSRLMIGGELVGHVVAAAVLIFPSFSPGSIVSFLHASAFLAASHSSLAPLLAHALTLVKEFSQRDSSSLLWVLALIGEQNAGPWRLLSDTLIAGDLCILDAQQLLFAHYACPFFLLAEHILARCRSLVSEIPRTSRISDIQRRVAQDLTALGFSTQLEVSISGIDACVDIVARRVLLLRLTAPHIF